MDERTHRQPAHGPTDTISLSLAPKRIALVARDWLQESARNPAAFLDSNMGFAPHFGVILRAVNEYGVDVVVFSLWSHDARKLGPLSRAELFPRGTQHHALILGVTTSAGEAVEVYARSERSPIALQQRFGRTSDPDAKKRALLSDLGTRFLGTTAVLLCGETNIVRTLRQRRQIVDAYGFLSQLRSAGIQLVLNPIHDYMHRFEMPLKRRALSRAGHMVACVWNRGCKNGPESLVPWAVYRDGCTVTSEVAEIAAFSSQPGIRIGVLDVA